MLLEQKSELIGSVHRDSVYTKSSKGVLWKCSKVEDLCQCKQEGYSDGHSKENNFVGGKCNFNNAIKISREWCKGNDIEHIVNTLGIPKSTVSAVYYKASNVAQNFIRSNIKDWQLGGPGVLVIVDTYPEGCANTNPIRMGRPILCITEVKSFPQKYWLEALDTFDGDNTEQIQSLKEHILQTVQSIILPGSILITPYMSTICSQGDFLGLRHLYPTIVSTRDLARHNTDQQSIFLNLETIWKSVLDVCEEAQFYNSMCVQQFIISHMWRRKYDDRSFEIFLHQLSLMY